jgi:hypothetical protein
MPTSDFRREAAAIVLAVAILTAGCASHSAAPALDRAPAGAAVAVESRCVVLGVQGLG